MTDEIVKDAEALALDAKAKADAVETAAADAAKDAAGKLDAETAANIRAAQERVHGLGHDLEAVAHWLVATTRGAIRDVGEAIRLIGSKL